MFPAERRPAHPLSACFPPSWFWSWALAFVALLLPIWAARAESAPQSRPAPAGDPSLASPTTQPVAPVTRAEEEEGRPETRPHFLDDLLAGTAFPKARLDLEMKGISLNLALTSIYQQNARGGSDTHNGHRITGSVDTELQLDFERMGLWKGGDVYVLGESAWNDAIDDKVGDLFGVNGDAIGDRPIRVRELWYQQRMFDEKLRIKLGKMDVAVDVDTNAYANWEVTQFLNNALINTGNMPLPDYGLGTIVSVVPVDWAHATLAVADAQADGNETGFRTTFHGEDYFFSALELGLTPVWKTALGDLPGGYRFILWYDPQSKEVFFDDRDGRRHQVPHKRDDTGFAFNMDQLLVQENPGKPGDAQGLGMFLRYGYAEEDVNLVEHFWSIGAQYLGLLPTRDDDVLAFGMAQGIISDQFRRIEEFGSRETVYELYYNMAVTPWLHVTPDLQYISDTGGDKSGRDSVVVGLRVVLQF